MISLLYQMPTIIQRLYGGVVWRLTPQEKNIFLTFDDGPIPQVTPQVLDILDSYQIKATFFMVGDNIRKYPDLMQEVAKRGHAIGNHTFNHLKGIKTSNKEYFDSIQKTDLLIDQLHPKGQNRLHLLRPPYGKIKFSQKRVLEKSYNIILWDIITHDYDKNLSPQQVLEIVKKYSRNGSIVVFHDSLKAQGNMFQVLPKAIDFWLSEGYQIKPIEHIANC